MKTNSKSTLCRLLSIFGMFLIITLMIPSTTKSQSSKAPVFLGTAGDFVILGKTGITTTGTTNVTGDIGISPEAASSMTGFGLIMDISNTFSTSSLVTGKIYAADYTTPTPTKMTTAIGDMETAYTNAAGRTSPDFTELYSGDLTGQTLTPGLYKWSSGVQLHAPGAVISGSASDIWIFQIAQDLELTSGAEFTLSGGAQASNIFWQVAGQVTLGTTAVMKGIILCQTQIVMSTGASLTGRALAQTAVTLDANSVSAPVLITSVGTDGQQMPAQYTLRQNFPNPFNPSTTIQYGVPEKSMVTVTIYNQLGQQIAMPVNGIKEAGYYNVEWNASKMTSGVYFYELKTDNYRDVKKLLLLK